MKKRVLSVLLVSSLALGTITLPATAFADDVDQKIEQSNKKIQDLNTQVAEAEEALAAVRTNIESVKEKSQKLQEEQAKLNEEVVTLTGEIEDLTKKIEKRDDKIKEQARAAQTGGVSEGYLEAVLSADSISEAITRLTAAGRLVSASNDLMKQQEQDKKAVETKRVETEEKVEKLNENAAELEAQKGVLIDQELQQTILVSTIEAEKTTEEGKKTQYLAEKEAAEKAREQQALQVAESQRLAREQQAAEDDVQNTVSSDSGQTSNNGTGTGTGSGNSNVEGGAGSGSTNDNSDGGGNIEVPTPAPIPNGNALVAEAYKHIGKPYTQEQGRRQGPDAFDCSGLTWYIYKTVTGRDIGGWTVPQESAGVQIPVSQAQAGDLLFWGGRGGTHHVALAIGGGQYIHAPTYGQTVTVATISQYYMPSFAVRVQ